MIDSYQISSLFNRCTARGYEPSDEAKRLFAEVNTAETPESRLAAARKDLQEALLRGDEKAASAAHAIITRDQNVASAWADFRAASQAFAQELIREFRDPAFELVRAQYNAVGARMEAAVATGAIDCDPAELMKSGDSKARGAWADVPDIVAELDSLAKLLGDIVSQCGPTKACAHYKHSTDPKHAMHPLGLLVTVGDAHPRRLVECWTWRGYTPERVNAQPPSAIDALCMGRGGRWAAMVQCGASLSVPFTELRAYQPLEILELVRTRQGVVDPYDSPEALAALHAQKAEEAKQAAKHAEEVRRVGGVA